MRDSGIRWRFTGNQKEVPIEAGMDVTNEPGIYIEGSHGIRIENVMVARNGVKNGDGQFMYFDTLTWSTDRSGCHRCFCDGEKRYRAVKPLSRTGARKRWRLT